MNGPVVATAADACYALPLAVMLRSMCEHASPDREITVFVLADGIGAELRRRVERSIGSGLELRWVEPPDGDPFHGLPLWGRLSATTYFKLRIAQIVPEGVARAIWLDPDCVVLEDIGGLWEQRLDDRTVLAAVDPFVPVVSSPFGVAGYGAEGMDPTAPYFNAGVLLVDVERWTNSGVPERARAYLERYGDRVFFLDQEGLNVALHGAWGPLDECWNRSVSAATLGRVASDEPPSILHYSGTLKPWRYRARGRFHAIYYRHLDLTDWVGWRPPQSLSGALLGLYRASGLRRLAHPFERRWFRRRVERTRHRVKSDNG